MTSLRILIVDDEPVLAALLADLLRALGHTVDAIASSEAEAVIAALKHEPDLMIVDASLGEGSGVSAVEDILRRRWIPHLFATANPASVLDRRPDAIVIQKPYFEADLVAAMDRAMKASGARAASS
jgi:CheY-like chemotaxis protein